jgi:phosphonate metabolism protein (transferase hexapeptide repeat family)
MNFVKALLNLIFRNSARLFYFFQGSKVKGYFCRRTRIGGNVITHRESHISRSIIGKYCRVGKNSIISDSEIGDYTYLTQGVIVDFARIGKYCSIADYSRIGAVEHPMERATTHVITYYSDYGILDKVDDSIYNRRKDNSVIIGHDVWIGHGVIILPGISIGNGAVIGAGAIVTKDVEDYNIVVGNPARPIRMRFERDIIECLQKIQWWDWPVDLIKYRINDFNEIKSFCQKYGIE